jgi:dolichyl-phosphate beta-glucosyltransferase
LQRIERWGFDPEILFLAEKQGLRVAEVAVRWAHDEHGRINPLRDGVRMFLDALKVRWNWATGKYSTPAAVATRTL